MFSTMRFITTWCRWLFAAALLFLAALPWSLASAATTTMVAQHSGKCLDVIGGGSGTGNGVQLEQWTCATGATNQQFTAQDMGGGQFEIVASHSNKCIGPVNGATANGTYIEQTDCVGSPQQLWSVTNTGVAGMYQVVSVPSGRCLDVIGGASGTADGVMVELWDCAGSANQTWAMAAPTVVPPATVVSKSSGKCLDVIGGGTGTGNGVKLEQWTCATGADNQAFTFKALGNGLYQVIAKHSGRCVEVVGASTGNGAAIDQWDCNGTQQQIWRLNDLGGGYKQIISSLSGKCLDVTGGGSGTSDGVLMEQWDCVQGADNQAWTIGGTGSPPHACTPSTVTPAVATQAAWDAQYSQQVNGNLGTLPDTGASKDFAWQGHYWVRAYISMAETYGDTKYLDMAVRMINYWIANLSQDSRGQAWSLSSGSSQSSLETAVISEAITLFAYEVWKDPRFTAYRSYADSYIGTVEPILGRYDRQWMQLAFADRPSFSASFYVYDTCGVDSNELCGGNSALEYNQGAALAKSLLMIDRVKRLKGLTPDPAYLTKANGAAAYFKAFAQANGAAYLWNYEGARLDGSPSVEDLSHAHLDLSLLNWAGKYGLGGLTNADMVRLAATLPNVLQGSPPIEVWLRINSSTDVNYYADPNHDRDSDRSSIGYDWIDLVDYDSSLLDKVVNVYNAKLAAATFSRALLGWAEIQRKRSCVSLY